MLGADDPVGRQDRQRTTAGADVDAAIFLRRGANIHQLRELIDERGLRSQKFAKPAPKHCLFEYVYLARPDTSLDGRSVHATRVDVGRRLAEEHPADADLVIPVPESGTPAAVGYAQASGIPSDPVAAKRISDMQNLVTEIRRFRSDQGLADRAQLGRDLNTAIQQRMATRMSAGRFSRTR